MGSNTKQSPSYRQRQSSKVAGQRLVYSHRCGRVMLNNVIVQNEGVDWDNECNIYWQHRVRYCQVLRCPCDVILSPSWANYILLLVCIVHAPSKLVLTVRFMVCRCSVMSLVTSICMADQSLRLPMLH